MTFDYAAAALYGIVQGITEFLPISSSAHLALIPYFTGLRDPGVFFDLSMHLGTALSVSLLYRRELANMLRSPTGVQARSFVLVTMVTGVVGLLLEKSGESWRENPSLMAISLCLFGLLLGAAEFYSRRKTPAMTWEKMKPFPHLVIFGLAQALAVIPGVSRSGVTITCALFLGMNIQEATRGSFLYSLPLIVAGMLLKGLRLAGQPGGLEAQAFSWSVLLFGVVVSFVVGLLAMSFMLKYAKKIGLYPYAIYRVILAAFLFFGAT